MCDLDPRWGSVAHPLYTTLHYVLNWGFWYGAFYLLGGHALACALFGSAHIWAIGIRTFNYAGHGGGKDKRREGIDFYRKDLSINRAWPGIVAGEWHNNHHLFPNSGRCGFLPHQVDFAWYYIRGLAAVGAVDSYRDNRREFYDKYYRPYLSAHQTQRVKAAKVPSLQ